MERAWYLQQAPTQEIEEIPSRQKTQHTLGDLSDDGQSPASRRAWAGLLPQAGCADHLVVVFGDAFATVEVPAPWTTGHRFAKLMVLTALVHEFCHDGGPEGIGGGADGNRCQCFDNRMNPKLPSEIEPTMEKM